MVIKYTYIKYNVSTFGENLIILKFSEVFLRYLLKQAAALACAARLTNASRSPKAPFGSPTCTIKFF